MTQSLPKHPKQQEITLYTKDYCPYCVAAKNLLTQKGFAFVEVDVGSDSARYDEMLKKAAPRRTVPQIFVGDRGIGGFDDMKKLDSEGKFEPLVFPSGR